MDCDIECGVGQRIAELAGLNSRVRSVHARIADSVRHGQVFRDTSEQSKVLRLVVLAVDFAVLTDRAAVVVACGGYRRSQSTPIGSTEYHIQTQGSDALRYEIAVEDICKVGSNVRRAAAFGAAPWVV